jgi:hypothetical protein
MTQQLSVRPGGPGGADTSLYSGSYATVNLGTQAATPIGATTIVKGTTYCRYLARFELTDIPIGSAIVSAKLTLVKDSGTYPNGAAFRLRRVTRGDWTELGATWNLYDGTNSWTVSGGDVDEEGGTEINLASSDTQLVFADLERLVADAITFRGGLLNLLVIGNETVTSEFVNVFTADDAEPTNRPHLEIEYVAPPELTITDLGDGSGATAAIAGLEAGSTSLLYLRPFSGDAGATPWQAGGFVDSTGELALSLAPGHYFAYVVSDAGGLQTASRVVYFTVTDGVEAIHSRCLAAVQSRIRMLALDGVADERVIIEKLPIARNFEPEDLPTIIVSPKRAAMPADAGTNGLDDVHYDVLVALVDSDNQQPTDVELLDRQLLWRQQISRAFRNQRLPGVPEVINSAVEPDDGPHEHGWKHELFNTALRLRFTSREPRGF